jgi:hypothetical protein
MPASSASGADRPAEQIDLEAGQQSDDNRRNPTPEFQQ